jgi:hypothetical protein
MGFKRLDAEDFLVSSTTVSSTVWSNNLPTLTTFFTSSTQQEVSTGTYHLNIYQTSSLDPEAEIQFSIAFASKNGGGTVNYNNNVPGLSPSRSIYGQFRNLILEDEEKDFIFGNNTIGENFYILNIERARYKEKLLPGSFNLTLETNSGVVNITDNSKDVELPEFFGTQRAYQLVSGSNGSGDFPTQGGSYGLFFPDISTIILNSSLLDSNSSNGGISLNTNTTPNTNGKNPSKLFEAIYVGGNFSLNTQETITSNFVFIRARNSEFNYTENPSFVNPDGEVIYDDFINDPKVYATTIGLYNDENELLAVAKISKPLQKDFTKEALIRMKLDF